jgi:hypothetical protein
MAKVEARSGQDRCDYAQRFLSRAPAYRRGHAALNTTTVARAKEDFARSWGLRFPHRS